jgi:hypothetical protein
MQELPETEIETRVDEFSSATRYPDGLTRRQDQELTRSVEIGAKYVRLAPEAPETPDSADFPAEYPQDTSEPPQIPENTPDFAENTPNSPENGQNNPEIHQIPAKIGLLQALRYARESHLPALYAQISVINSAVTAAEIALANDDGPGVAAAYHQMASLGG